MSKILIVEYSLPSIEQLPTLNEVKVIKGELKITYHNYNNAILSGTFWFDAVNSTGEIVQVREGRFDIHY